MSDFNKKADMAFRAGLAGYFLQMALIIATNTMVVPALMGTGLVMGVLFCVPLLILLPWLLKRNIRAFIWLCFIELGYFIPATQHLFMFKQYGWIAVMEEFFVVYIFIIAMLFGRWEQKRFGISVTR